MPETLPTTAHDTPRARRARGGRRTRRLLAGAATAVGAALALPGIAAAAPEYVPGEVIVKYKDGTTQSERAQIQQATDTSYEAPVAPQTSVLETPPGQSVSETIDELRKREDVEYAVPNVVAKAAFEPNDPGMGDGWQRLQWNFVGPASVNVTPAWDRLIDAGRPGARGVTIAVLDTGVAYRNWGPYRKSPDLNTASFVSGYDFVARNRYPLDRNGHGTHVASTLVEATNNGRAVTGLVYNAKIMPLRVLNSEGSGDAATIARAIRYAVQRGVKIINLSLEFGVSVEGWQIPDVLSAIRYAIRNNAIVIAAAGNEGRRVIAYPARTNRAVAVGATTANLCLADYSNYGRGLDIVAPGGGGNSPSEVIGSCDSKNGPSRPIYQMTFRHAGDFRNFGLDVSPPYEGTSMATPHVSAGVAMIRALGVLGRNPTPRAIERHLKNTARDLGAPGPDRVYGAGLVDLDKATQRPSGSRR